MQEPERRGASPLLIVAWTASAAGIAVVLGAVQVLSGDEPVLERVQKFLAGTNQEVLAANDPLSGPPPVSAVAAAPGDPVHGSVDAPGPEAPSRSEDDALDDLLLLTTLDSIYRSIQRIHEVEMEVEAARTDVASFRLIGGLDREINLAKRSIAASQETAKALEEEAIGAAVRLLQRAQAMRAEILAVLETALDESSLSWSPERAELAGAFHGSIQDLPAAKSGLEGRARATLQPFLAR